MAAPVDNVDRDACYAGVMAYARGAANDEILARMHASSMAGAGALPVGWGLSPPAYAALMEHHFPGYFEDIPGLEEPDRRHPRRDEVAELEHLLLGHRAGRSPSEFWMATIVATACLAGDHLWQDLGLWSRADLGRLMQVNFPALAAQNVRDMKWKKFLYKQLCVTEGVYTCRAPSCEVCADYDACFGPE